MVCHIVNGDSTLEMLRETNKGAFIIPWRDVLHDGKVVAQDNPAYASIRAEHLANAMCLVDTTLNKSDELQRIANDFKQREKHLNAITKDQELFLWFEHDLYDQLQLLEVLAHPVVFNHPNVSLISIDSHPDVRYFHGFGNLTPNQLIQLSPSRVKVTDDFKVLAKQAWLTILSSNPNNILVNTQLTSFMPFWQSALNRYCDEFPSSHNGLTLTQQLLLKTIAQPAEELRYLRYCLQLDDENNSFESTVTYDRALRSHSTFKRIFWQMQDEEKVPFMGDLGLLKELKLMLDLPLPLINSRSNDGEAVYQLTDIGESILMNQSHWLDHNTFSYERGGVSICEETPWQWNSRLRKFSCE